MYHHYHGRNCKGSALAEFRPTPASIPPPNTGFTLSTPHGLPVNLHPLVRVLCQYSTSGASKLFCLLQNPLEFLLRAAQIYPEKLALAHPDVQFPVFYTYSVWYDFTLHSLSSLNTVLKGTTGTELCIWSPSGWYSTRR